MSSLGSTQCLSLPIYVFVLSNVCLLPLKYIASQYFTTEGYRAGTFRILSVLARCGLCSQHQAIGKRKPVNL